MIEFKDFVPKLLGKAGLLGEPQFESLSDAVTGCNAWLEANPDVRILNVETVVLPNIHNPFEEGSQDVNIREDEDFVTPWNQFLRVWFERS
jgi:hypothetical protein